MPPSCGVLLTHSQMDVRSDEGVFSSRVIEVRDRGINQCPECNSNAVQQAAQRAKNKNERNRTLMMLICATGFFCWPAVRQFMTGIGTEYFLVRRCLRAPRSAFTSVLSHLYERQHLVGHMLPNTHSKFENGNILFMYHPSHPYLLFCNLARH